MAEVKGYGCDRLGRLTTALTHRPGPELSLIDEENHERWLFDSVPDVGPFIEEYDRYRELLASLGVEVLELEDYVTEQRGRISSLPNLMYMHDIAVVSDMGAILSTMASEGRRDEQLVVKEGLEALGIPMLFELEGPDDAFEGCLLLEDGVIVAQTERHSGSSVDTFVREAVCHFPEVIRVDVPQARRFMHPDTIFNRIRDDLALAYPPAFLRTRVFTGEEVRKVDFFEHIREKGFEIVEVSDAEQRRLACSFVPLEPGVILHYDTALEAETRKLLEKKGVEFVLFHPHYLLAGGGSLRCLTLRIHRDAC